MPQRTLRNIFHEKVSPKRFAQHFENQQYTKNRFPIFGASFFRISLSIKHLHATHQNLNTSTKANFLPALNAKRYSARCALWGSEDTLGRVSCLISYTILYPTCPTSPIIRISSSTVLATSPTNTPEELPKHFFVNKFDNSPNCNIFALLNQKVYRLQSMPGWRNR